MSLAVSLALIAIALAVVAIAMAIAALVTPRMSSARLGATDVRPEDLVILDSSWSSLEDER